MATLNESYQYIGRSNAVGSPAGWKFYILLYAKTSGDKTTGKHSVTVKQRLACDVRSTFYGFCTTASVTVGGESAFSWSWANVPGGPWNEESITEGGVTYPRWIDLKEGTVVVNTGYGASKNVTIASSWVVEEDSTKDYVPYKGKKATVSIAVTLPMIASASAITSAADVAFGSKCNVSWTPMAASFRYKLKFAVGNWAYTTGVIHPNQTSAYTYTGYVIPLEAAKQIPNDRTGAMTVTLYTYLDSGATTQIGSADSETFTVTVPDNADTKPNAKTMVLSPVSSLGDDFAGLYIQGLSKVKVTSSEEGQYGATITGKSITVEGNSYGSDSEYTSNYISGYGTIYVTLTLRDSRGFTNSKTLSISVIPYTRPTIVPLVNEKSIVCARCDADGKLSDSGTYLRIKARRSFALCVVDGVQKNYCTLRYRYKKSTDSYFSEWQNLLAETDSTTDEVDTKLFNGTLSATTSYVVQIDAIDTILNHTPVTFDIPTDEVYLHKAGSIGSLGFGEYVEEPNIISIAKDKSVRLKSNINGVRMASVSVSGTKELNIQSKYLDFSGTGNERQSFFVFGEANGSTVYGVARVANNGTTKWGGSSGVTLTTKGGGVLTVVLPTVAYDIFTIISGGDFSV